MKAHKRIAIPLASVEIIQYDFESPLDATTIINDNYWIDLSLTPRPPGNRACYVDHWGPHKFKRLGSLFLIPPGEILHVRGDAGGSHSSIVCQLRANAFETLLGSPLALSEAHLDMTLDLHNVRMRHLLQRLAEEVHSGRRDSLLMAESISVQLCVELHRHFEGAEQEPVNGGLASWRLRIIDERLSQPDAPTVGELAKLCKMSVRHLTRAFPISRGLSIGAHIKETRIEIAKRLLTEGRSVKEIAASLGFSSSSSFARAFRASVNVTPREFHSRISAGSG